MDESGACDMAIGCLADLGPSLRAFLVHLGQCAHCQSLVQHLGPPKVDEMWQGSPPDRAGAPSSVEGSARWLDEDSIGEDAAREDELVQRVGSGDLHHRARVLREERYWTIGCVEALLETSLLHLGGDPVEAETLANLAGRLVLHLREQRGGGFVSHLVRARVIAGTARRLQGLRTGAEEAFLGGAEELETLPRSSMVRGEYCRSLALLRWDEGRAEEAAGLLRQSIRAFEGKGVAVEVADSVLLLGLLELERAAPENAVLLLSSGFVGHDVETRSWLTVRASLGLAQALAECGDAGSARAVLNDALSRYCTVDDEQQVDLLWREGRVRARLGDRVDAEHLFERIRKHQLAAGEVDGILSSVDLAVLLGEKGRRREVTRIFRELQEQYSGRRSEESGIALARELVGELLRGNGRGGSIVARVRQRLRTAGCQAESIPYF